MFLFLVVLALPTVAIIALSRNNAAQERELARKEQEETRRRLVADIGQDILDRLVRIKLQQIAGAPAGAVTQTPTSSDPAVAFVGREVGGRLIWPWDAARIASPSPDFEQSEFSLRMREADRAELRERNFAQAESSYRQAIRVAMTDTERASAKLLLANVLTRSGAAAEATRLYRELLNVPSTVVDDQAMPFASYAARRLAEAQTAEDQILERLKHDLESAVPLTPGWAYGMRSILEALRDSPEAATLMEQLAGRIKDLEEALEVQEKFEELRVNGDTWQLYAGNALWWIGKAQTGTSSLPLILAVRLDEIRKNVTAERISRGGPSFQIITNGAGGEPLGDSLPGVRLALGPESVSASSSGSQRYFYEFSLFLVVMFTFIGAFFLWRDTRRESRMAELRSQFVASVSHELKTPLTSIRMFAESMQMDEESGASDPKERVEYLNTIVCETERLTRLLNNVLDFSRIERGQKHYHLQVEELPAVVTAAVRTMRFPLTEQGFNLQLDLSRDLPRLKVDRDAIEQAILNLLSNAMKYSGKSRNIALRVCRRNGDALIQVSDHGVGIPVGEQRRIFEKFYRVSSKENRAISGTGLGLSLVAHIAEAHGGGVEVESRPGEGSTFSIRLPLNGVSE
jgi:nitrogen-specific signal transduction histidine kinase